MRSTQRSNNDEHELYAPHHIFTFSQFNAIGSRIRRKFMNPPVITTISAARHVAWRLEGYNVDRHEGRFARSGQQWFDSAAACEA